MAQELSILHVVRSPIGGIFRHIADLSRAQADAGHSVGLICDSSTGGAFEAEHIAALAPQLRLGVARLPMARSITPADAITVAAVARQISRTVPDIIHAHGAKGGVFGRLGATLARLRGRRTAAFYAPHGGSLHYDPASSGGRVYFAVERALERVTDGLIHVSAYEAETYRRKVGAPRCPAHIVLNGLAPEEFVEVEPHPDAVDFLYIGMLRDLKGVDVFLAALALLGQQNRRFRALVIGAGEAHDERRYADIVKNAGLSGRVEFRPPMPARKAFALARTIVVPSRAESMPYIVLEAIAAGVPIIATDVGGIPEILSSSAERLVAPGDITDLAQAMGVALEAPERMRGAADARRSRIRQKFSLAGMASQVEDIYRRALERYREPRSTPLVETGFTR